MVLDKVTTRYVSLMLTHKCNLNCVYCYEQFKSSNVIDVDKAKEYIQRAFEDTVASGKYKALELSFMGGEPLLEFDKIKELCEWLWSKKWPLKHIVFASTNGTLLTEDMKQWLEANKAKIVLGVSLDGNSESQSFNRGELASKIDIDFFVKTWPNQGIKATISKESIKHLAEDIIFIHSKGFNTIYANLAFGIDWDKNDLSVYKEQLLKLVDFYIENPSLSRCSLLNLDLLTILDASGKYEKYCGCGEGTILIETDGRVYPCPVFSPITLPADRLEVLDEIDFSNPDNFNDPKCNKCLLHRSCPKCYGISFLLSGDPAFVPPFNCIAYRIQVLANCILQKKLLQGDRIPEDKKNSLSKILHILELLFNL